MVKSENGKVEIQGNTSDVICDLALALGATAREMTAGEKDLIGEAEDFIAVVVGATKFWLNKKGISVTMNGIAAHFEEHDHD